MLKVTRSRRVAGLKPTDYDHEIDLIDHDAARTPPIPMTPEATEMVRSSTTSRLLNTSDQEGDGVPTSGQDDTAANTDQEEAQEPSSPSGNQQNGNDLPQPVMRPSIEIQGEP